MPVIAIDAPVGGINAFDSVDSMPPTDAVSLVNWIPRSGFLESRPGFITWADLGTAEIGTLTAYKGKSNFQLIAGTDGDLWNITTLTPASIGTGYGTSRWQTAMINNYLIFCNGDDAEMSWNGTTMADLDYTGSNPVITPGEFIGVTNFKGRAIYWKANSLSFWYAEAGSFQGILEEFNLGPVLQVGGHIVTVFTWTVDSGTGPDDMLVFAFSTGEILLYQGDDPGNVGYFEQVGRFAMPDPLSIRGHVKFGSDVIVMTKDGYVNLSTVLKDNAISDYPAFSRKISRLVYTIGRDYGSYYGHECLQTDTGLLLFNIPIGNSKSQQLIFNSATGSWSQFKGINAVTFHVFEDNVYFGGYGGKVYKMGGVSDDGGAIQLDALPAYNYLDDPGTQKQITAVQILSTFPKPVLISLSGYADFEIPTLVNTTAPPGAIAGSLWNTELWDTVLWSRLSDELPTTKGWQNVHAFGFAVTCSVQMSIKSQTVKWRQTGIRYRVAGAQ